MSTSTWPENCPTCGAAWKIKSRTMGAAHGQPHRGTCSNGHSWYEGQPPPRPETHPLPAGLPLIPWQTQRQDALNDQLSDLIQVAVRLGMYDAADYIARQLATPKAAG
jgi:hypothetical protein